MSISWTILFKTLVRPFYKQNAGLFAFLLFFMVAAVGRANGVGLLEYHFSLIQGMMTKFSFLLFVLSLWLLYAVRSALFISDTLGKKETVFLSLLSLKKSSYTLLLLWIVQLLVLLPVLLYAFISLWIGIVHHWWFAVVIIFFFFLFISLSGAVWYQFRLFHQVERKSISWLKWLSFQKHSYYWLFLLRYIWDSRKLLFLAIKLFNCLMLFGLIYGQSGDQSGFQMLILFFSIGMLGHGVLIYSIRGMEEYQLAFYRALPVSLIRRFINYAVFYLILVIPEILVIQWLAPGYLSISNALLLIFFGYSILLLLNSILFIEFYKKSAYLKIITGIYGMVFIALLAGFFAICCGALFILSAYIFYRNYYRFEK